MTNLHQKNDRQTAPLSDRIFVQVLTLLLALILSGCAGYNDTIGTDAGLHIIVNNPSSDLLRSFAPVLVLPGAKESHNRIGKVLAEKNNGHEKIIIDPTHPVIYADKRPFSTRFGTYINMVYRVHFQKTPFSLVPFHFATGNNIGFLVIVTLNEDYTPLLVTTVNTCGCYALVIPTAALPADAYPEDWKPEKQYFYGEKLPTSIPAYTRDDSLLITVRPEVHRVMNVTVSHRKELAAKNLAVAEIMPLQSLKRLPLQHGEVTSLYYDAWPLQGHVKGSIKLWESLLLSLVSLDFYVGMDKEYGDTAVSGNPFYTSLLPWNRQASDLNDFAGFLGFWGWRL